MKLYSAAAYLLLVSFMSGTSGSFTPDMEKSIKGSPYDGVAVQYTRAYDHSPVDHSKKEKEFAEISRASGKDAWPWVFMNRMVGYEKGKSSDYAAEKKSYFGKIAGMDLYDEAGERSAFLDIWRGALSAASRSGAPGVVLDLETYNNSSAYRVDYLSRVLGRPRDEVVSRLKGLGRDMADIAAREYPGATVWFLFTGLGNRMPDRDGLGYEYMTIGYVVLGMLERSAGEGHSLKFVSGGESSLGYCSKDLEDLKEKIDRRREVYKEHLDAFPALGLAGVAAPWIDAGEKTGWLTKATCGESRVATAEEFVPLFRELIKNYRYVWVYAAGTSDYDPFDAASSARIDAALRRSITGRASVIFSPMQ